MSTSQQAFTFDGGRVDPGETVHVRFAISETYFGDPVRIPVTVVNSEEPGPTIFLSAAAHGDELNGIEVVRRVATALDHTEICGTLVCLPVLNAQAFLAQQRYLPIYDRDLNRAFPGVPDGTGAERVAHLIYRNFVAPCDLGLDFHTSTRGRTNMIHVRADMTDDAVARLARAFGSRVVISSEGATGMLRREASLDGVPTITVEMGEAHRFQRDLIERAVGGVLSVFGEYDIQPGNQVRWPGWRAVIDGDEEKTWLRADDGGIVDMRFEPGALVHEGDTVCTIGDPFAQEATRVRAPFTGLLVGVLENPVVYPGNPLCHLVRIDPVVERAIEGDEHRSDATVGA